VGNERNYHCVLLGLLGHEINVINLNDYRTGERDRESSRYTLRQDVPLQKADTSGRSITREVAFNADWKSGQFFATALQHVLDGGDTFEMDIVVLYVVVDHFGCRSETSHPGRRIQTKARKHVNNQGRKQPPTVTKFDQISKADYQMNLEIAGRKTNLR
jgi:hypothetical protein